MSKLFAVDSMAVLYRGYFAMIRTPLNKFKRFEHKWNQDIFNAVDKDN